MIFKRQHVTKFLCFSCVLLRYSVSLTYFPLRVVLEQDVCLLYTGASEWLSSIVEIASNVLHVLHGTSIQM